MRRGKASTGLATPRKRQVFTFTVSVSFRISSVLFSASSLSEVSSEDTLTRLRRLRRLSSESELVGLSLEERLRVVPQVMVPSQEDQNKRALGAYPSRARVLCQEGHGRSASLPRSPLGKVSCFVILEFCGSVLSVPVPTDGANLLIQKLGDP
ncbi:hypothetical protein Tco_1144321 [Tanacetum coccineum]